MFKPLVDMLKEGKNIPRFEVGVSSAAGIDKPQNSAQMVKFMLKRTILVILLINGTP